MKPVVKPVETLEEVKPGTYCKYLDGFVVFIKGYNPFVLKDGLKKDVELNHESVVEKLEQIW